MCVLGETQGWEEELYRCMQAIFYPLLKLPSFSCLPNGILKKKLCILIWGWLLYSVVVVSAIHQHGSAIGYTCPACPRPEPPSRLPLCPTPLGCRRAPAQAPCVTQELPPAVLHMVMYMFQCYCLGLAHSPSTTVSTSRFSISASPLLPCK